MKKTLFIGLILIMMAVIFPLTVWAATGSENEPHIVKTVDELTEAFAEGGYIQLGADINVGEFTGDKLVVAKDKTITLDLNGYSISGKSSSATISTNLINNKGTLVINDKSVEKDGKITMDDTHERRYAWANAMLTISNSGTLTINNGTIENIGETDVPYAIDNNSTAGNPKLTINGGTVSGKVLAIRSFANSTSNRNEIIINGGNVTGGSSAIWLQQPNAKACKVSLDVAGGEISAEKSYSIYADVNNSDAANAVSIEITGGIIKNNSETKATVAFVPCTGNSLENAPLNLSISGGTIRNGNTAGPVVMDEEYTNIKTDGIKITGGTFSADVSEYIDETSGITSATGDNGMILIGIKNKIKIEKVENGTVTSSLTEAIKGQTVTLTVTQKDGYKLKSLTVNGVAVTGTTFTMPDEEVTVKAEFEKIPVVEEEKDDEPKMGTMNVSTYAWVTLATIALVGIVTTKKSSKHSK